MARASLRAAAAAGIGYQHLHPRGADIVQLFGQPVPVGPLDDASHLFVTLPDFTFQRFTVLIEVKNLRHWIYRSNDELFQLLTKAVMLQLAFPKELFVPVLICRRAQQQVFWMAKDLGFLVFMTKTQPIAQHSEAPPEAVEEVRAELGYDLSQSEEPHPLLVHNFREVIPKNAPRVAERWRATALALRNSLSTLHALRSDALSPSRRDNAMHTFLTAIQAIPDIEGRWIAANELDDDSAENVPF